MTRTLFVFTLLTACLLAAAKPAPTYHREVARILQNRCQECHRPGEAAPMPLLTYQQVRPWAKAIKQSVLAKKMPPWFAAPGVGHWANDRSLTAAEIQTVSDWVDAGAPEGSPKDEPAARTFATGWGIGQPDVVFEMPKPFAIPASGTIHYHYVIIPTGFKEDRWVTAAEIRPGNRAVNHHVIAYLREPGSKWFEGMPVGEAFLPGKRNSEGGASGFLVGYAPGVPATVLEPGQAKLVKAGTDIVLQLHYTANGKEATDQSKVGLVFAKEPPREQVLTLSATNSRFEIPPGAADYPVQSKFEFRGGGKLVALIPHMHLRGKSFEFRLVYPDGRTDVLLKVPRYDFNWQLGYQPAPFIEVPAGARLECTATFDNSPNNPYNPDPKATVRWGEQSWDEMMMGFFDIAIDAKLDPASHFRGRPAAARSTNGGE